LNLAILLCLLFLQVGFTYWLSFQGLMAGLLLFKFRSILVAAIAQEFPIKAAVSGLMVMLVVFGASTDFFHDFLVVCRQAAFLLLMVSIVKSLNGGSFERHVRETAGIVFLVATGLTILIVLQTVFTPLGIYIGIPKDLFIANAITIPEENQLLWSAAAGAVLRPMGTFGEPSYCGFVLLSIFVMYHRYLKSSDKYMRGMATRIVILTIVGGLMLKSFLFIVAIGPLLYFALFKRFNLRKLVWPAVGLALLLVAAARFGLLSNMVLRLGAALSGEIDPSTMARLVAPAIALGPYLLAHPFGAPFSRLNDVLLPFSAPFGMTGEDIGNTAFFNLFFNFGFVGLPVLWLILRSGSDATFKLYLLLAAFQNGAILSVDKFGIICLTACMYESSKKRSSVLRSARKIEVEPAVRVEPC
jgi:hypothetical protein